MQVGSESVPLSLQGPAGEAPVTGASHRQALPGCGGEGTARDLRQGQPGLKAELAVSQMGDPARVAEIL